MSDSSVSGKKRGRPKRTEFKNKPDDRLKLMNANTIAKLTNLKQNNLRILRSGSSQQTQPSQKDEQSQSSQSKPVKMDTTVSPDIPTKNKFGSLPSDVNTSQQTTEVVNNKNKYVPPIIVQGLTISEITDLLKTNKITEYRIKLLSIGIKVTLFDLTVSVTLKNILKTANLEFFTFSERNLNQLKVMLSGLPLFTIEQVRAELIYSGINEEYIIEIISLKSKERHYNIHSNTNFLIKFDRTKITLKALQKIKSMFNIIVRWFPYVVKRTGPTQCRRCQMYGHGTSHCHKSVKCLKCGGNHLTDSCTETLTKCANCGEPHEANYKDCIKRKEYMLIRENSQINRQITNLSPKPLTAAQLAQHTLNLERNQNNFPNITQRSHQSHHHWASQFSTPPPPIRPPGPTANNSELFSIEEMTSIVSDVIQKMAVCTTRAQQLEVIFQISLRYLSRP